MTILKIAGVDYNVPPLHLGALIDAGVHIDAINASNSADKALMEDSAAFAARPFSDNYATIKAVLAIVEVATVDEETPLLAKDLLKKASQKDVLAINMFFYDLLADSGFGEKQGEAEAAASTPISNEAAT